MRLGTVMLVVAGVVAGVVLFTPGLGDAYFVLGCILGGVLGQFAHRRLVYRD